MGLLIAMKKDAKKETLWAYAQVYHACKLLKQQQSWQLLSVRL